MAWVAPRGGGEKWAAVWRAPAVENRERSRLWKDAPGQGQTEEMRLARRAEPVGAFGQFKHRDEGDRDRQRLH